MAAPQDERWTEAIRWRSGRGRCLVAMGILHSCGLAGHRRAGGTTHTFRLRNRHGSRERAC